MRCRLLIDGLQDPVWNMAVDEALWRLSPVPALRFYGWSRPCLTVGYFGRSGMADTFGLPWVRRCTGGGIVDHREDLTYALAVPPGIGPATLSAPESYRRIHEAVRDALVLTGLPAVLADCCAKEGSGQCFAGHSKHDVLVLGRKVAGAAQKRGRTGLLHQGSILLPSGRCEGLEQPLAEAFASAFGWTMKRSSLEPQEIRLVEELREQRYGNEDWNRKF